MARDKQVGYLSALVAKTNFTYEAVVAPMSDFRCMECHSIYVDPCLSDAALNELYLSAAPIHQNGWGKFTSRLLEDPSAHDEVSVIGNYIVGRFGLPQNYLEVGCPFSGLGLFFTLPEELGSAIADRGGMSETYPDRGRRRLLRYSIRLENRVRDINSMMTERWLQSARFARLRAPKDPYKFCGQTAVSLLAEYSVNRWSFECRAFGRSCVGLAKSSFVDTVVSRERLRDYSLGHFDLGGIFNSFDHADKPLELLREVSRACKRVVVVGHRTGDAYLQHRFALDDDSIPILAAKIGSTCEDIGNELGELAHDWFAFLLEKSYG